MHRLPAADRDRRGVGRQAGRLPLLPQNDHGPRVINAGRYGRSSGRPTCNTTDDGSGSCILGCAAATDPTRDIDTRGFRVGHDRSRRARADSLLRRLHARLCGYPASACGRVCFGYGPGGDGGEPDGGVGGVSAGGIRRHSSRLDACVVGVDVWWIGVLGRGVGLFDHRTSRFCAARHGPRLPTHMCDLAAAELLRIRDRYRVRNGSACGGGLGAGLLVRSVGRSACGDQECRPAASALHALAAHGVGHAQYCAAGKPGALNRHGHRFSHRFWKPTRRPCGPLPLPRGLGVRASETPVAQQRPSPPRIPQPQPKATIYFRRFSCRDPVGGSRRAECKYDRELRRLAPLPGLWLHQRLGAFDHASGDDLLSGPGVIGQLVHRREHDLFHHRTKGAGTGFSGESALGN